MNSGSLQNNRKRIAALVPNVLGVSPGQRVRIELWSKYLTAAGWNVEFFPFEDELLHEVLYGNGNSLRKASGLLRCYGKQLGLVLRHFSTDIIFIYREASLIGPAFLERLLARQNIPIVFDLDDPVFLPYKSPANSWASLLKFSRKTHTLFRLSTHIIAINKQIADYASQYNPNVTIIPNFIDTNRYVPRKKNGATDSDTKLVWIGSQSTMQMLSGIVGPIKRLQSEFRAPLLIIGAGDANLAIEQLSVRQWSAETEVSSLQEGDIGLLPLNDLPWNRWKFFFKAIQYMAVGLPVVARRMGSNSEVIQDGINGFLVETDDEWYDRLRFLVCNPDARKKMGEAARQTVLQRFSHTAQIPRVLSVFENVLRADHANRDPRIVYT